MEQRSSDHLLALWGHEGHLSTHLSVSLFVQGEDPDKPFDFLHKKTGVMDSFSQLRVKALGETTKALTPGQCLEMHFKRRRNGRMKRGWTWHYSKVGEMYSFANFKVSASLFLPRKKKKESNYLF